MLSILVFGTSSSITNCILLLLDSNLCLDEDIAKGQNSKNKEEEPTLVLQSLLVVLRTKIRQAC